MISQNFPFVRFRSCTWASNALLQKRAHHSGIKSHAVVVGCYKDEESDLQLTPTGNTLQTIIGTNILQLLGLSNFKAQSGTCRNFYNLHENYPCITVAGLGDVVTEFDGNEGIDENRENVRAGIGAAVKSLQKDDFVHVSVDACGFASASAEGAHLAGYVFDKYKSKKKDRLEVTLLDLNGSGDRNEWESGIIAAESQNFARELMETPSNYKYPQLLAQNIIERFSSYGNVDLTVRDEAWAEEKKMNCLLSVGRGSTNRSAILELHYRGGQDPASKPIVLVGKGVTFDSGGISIKPSKGMGLMRGDMGGAACVLATLEAVVRMNMPVNITVLVGLVENMPSGSATKPGDVFTAMNSKTVEVDNTDAEGRLVLADLLCYANEFNPCFVINAATLTGAMDVALGAATTGTFTTCDTLWGHLDKSGQCTGDRMWRMPLYRYYSKEMECSETADLRNTQKKAGSAGSCTAAAFLKEFVETKHWAHLDIAGVMNDRGGVAYMAPGMSGRPTRTLIEAVKRISAS